MARDIRKLDVIKEMRVRNKMFANPSKYVVLKSEEFYSKKPIFENETNGLPVTKVVSEKKVAEEKEVTPPKPDPEDRTLKDLLHDLNQKDSEDTPKKDESVSRGTESEGGDSSSGTKRGRSDDDEPGSGTGGGADTSEGNEPKRTKSDGGAKEEEAQAEKAEEGGAGRGGEPDSEKEAQA